MKMTQEGNRVIAAAPRQGAASDGSVSLRSLDATRICILKPSALGDVVQSLPLLPALRRRFPAASISWVINRHLAGLIERHSQLDEVISFDRRGTWRDVWGLLRDLRRRRFDLVFDLQGLLRTAVMSLATGARYRVGLQTAREGSGWACHATIPETSRAVPAWQRCFNVIQALGLSDWRPETGLEIPSAAREWAASRMQPIPRPILAMHAGAGWVTKRWPVEKFAAIAARFPGSVVAVGTGSEAPLAAHIISEVGRAGGCGLDLAGKTTLPELAALLERADLVLSNDSGPMHLAAAAGTPVVGVFTCTSPTISGPAGSQHELVATTVDCAARYCKQCPNRGEDHLACLEELSVERVWRGIERVLQRGERKTA
ncbi:MAG: glycosyltransferase family 9 protein [Planctomycetales bacterium]